jgi:hypothetical protein
MLPCGIELVTVGNVLFLEAQGCHIAKREDGKWVLLEPGWSQWLKFEVETVLHVEGRS